MIKTMVYLNSIEKVKDFISVTNNMDCRLDLVSGRYIVDGKSILGIFSLDLSKPVELYINSDNMMEDYVPDELEVFQSEAEGFAL